MNQHPRNPKATLFAFSYGGLKDATQISVFREWNQWPNLTYEIKGGDANIDRARSKVASVFLERPEEEAGSVLLMVDSDNAWEPGDLAYIAKRALEYNAVVGGIYPKRVFNQGLAMQPIKDSEGDYTIGQEQMIPCEYVGTGFIAIPRVILEALRETLPLCQLGIYPFFMPFILERDGVYAYPTDDVAFCARVRNAGFEVFASTYPHLTHEGTFMYRPQDSAIEPPPTRDWEFSLGSYANVRA